MIYLVRHGQTDWNLFKRFNGRTNTYLNQTGIEQARLLAKTLDRVSFSACFCSPQMRARQFCEIIYKWQEQEKEREKNAVVFDERLSEINCGEFEGSEETPESMKMFLEAIKSGAMGTESIDSFIGRNCSLCDEITEKHIGKNVLIVTHAANARVIDFYFKGKPKDYDFSKRAVEEGGLLNFYT